MFGSEILEVAIGLVFVYLLLSMICSVFNEWISRMVAMRSRDLEGGIRNLLQKEDLVYEVYKHPLVKGFYRQGLFDRWLKREGKPSYIPARTFALALLDIVAPADPDAKPKEFDQVRDAAAKSTLLGEEMRKTVLALMDETVNDLKKARQNIENWFDDAMDQVSGWYKRKAQLIILGLALIVSLVLNADSITIANSLFGDATVRASVVAAAVETAKQQQPAPTGTDTDFTMVSRIQTELQQLGFPIGWIQASDKYVDPREVPSGPQGWLNKLVGLLITSFAVSMGAPFWFDMLNKLVNLRATSKVPERASEERLAGTTEPP
jgi:hypothetical protein